MRELENQPGFTLVEVLIAATVLTIALGGILTMGLQSLKRAGSPDKIVVAGLLANERLSYFRSQPNPYRAAGGTYYPPPTAKTDPDYNLPGDGNGMHVIADDRPILFVREYLHTPTEKQFASDAGRDVARQRSVRAVNSIPDTPTAGNIGAILPNPDSEAALPNVPALNGYTFSFAPRANDTLRNGQDMPETIAYVREVWIQTNHPYMDAGPTGIALPNANALEPLFAANDFGSLTAPPMQRNLPAFSLAVTVRVYARDKSTVRLNSAFSGLRDTSQVPYRGIGYDKNKPLATVLGIIGLRRGTF